MICSQGTCVNLSTLDRVSPLHGACVQGHLACAELLIQNGANVSTAASFCEGSWPITLTPGCFRDWASESSPPGPQSSQVFCPPRQKSGNEFSTWKVVKPGGITALQDWVLRRRQFVLFLFSSVKKDNPGFRLVLLCVWRMRCTNVQRDKLTSGWVSNWCGGILYYFKCTKYLMWRFCSSLISGCLYWWWPPSLAELVLLWASGKMENTFDYGPEDFRLDSWLVSLLSRSHLQIIHMMRWGQRGLALFFSTHLLHHSDKSWSCFFSSDIWFFSPVQPELPVLKGSSFLPPLIILLLMHSCWGPGITRLTTDQKTPGSTPGWLVAL